MATVTTAPLPDVQATREPHPSSTITRAFEPTEFTFNAELNEIFTQAVEALGVPREKGVIWAVSLLRFAAQAKVEGKALGIASDPDVLDEQIVGF